MKMLITTLSSVMPHAKAEIEPVGHFVLRDQRIPQQEGQRVVADERAEHRADSRRGDGVGEVVHLDLMRGEAERLQRAHLHALVVNHTGEGRHDD